MKKRVNWLLIPVLILALGGCEKKEEVKTPDAPPAAAEVAGKEVPAPVAPAKAGGLKADERAAKLGFVQYLPQDTEAVMALHNGAKTVDRVKASKLWKLVEEQMGEAGIDTSTVEPDGGPAGAAEPAGPAGLFAT